MPRLGLTAGVGVRQDQTSMMLGRPLNVGEWVRVPHPALSERETHVLVLLVLQDDKRRMPPKLQGLRTTWMG